MEILDDLTHIERIDTSNCLRSISLLPDQCESAWSVVGKLDIPDDYGRVSSVLFCGMGGSSYGGRLIKSLFGNKMKVSIDMVNDYHIPAYANERTLVIAASYSGNTEETISCVEEAIARNLKIIGISSGGDLAAALSRCTRPTYTFIPAHNPSMQPRIGQGYMQVGQMALLAKLELISLNDKEITAMIAKLRILQKSLLANVPTKDNPAKQLAVSLKDKIVNLIGAEFLEGALHAIRNPFHETGKHFANYFIIPEMNHHLLEGLAFPEKNKEDLLFLFIFSSLYSGPIKRRMELTRDVVAKNDIETKTVKLSSLTEFESAFELIQLGSFAAFYLGILHNQDPVKVPWVDYFKKKLSAKG